MNHLFTDDDITFLLALARRGIASRDSGCQIHAKILLEQLEHRATLERSHVIRALDDKICLHARSVARLLGEPMPLMC